MTASRTCKTAPVPARAEAMSCCAFSGMNSVLTAGAMFVASVFVMLCLLRLCGIIVSIISITLILALVIKPDTISYRRSARQAV